MAQSDFLELDGQDAYQILGLTPLATPDEIRSARRTRQMAVHPDRHGDAEQSKLVNYAAQILLNDETRRDYDQFRTRSWLAVTQQLATDQLTEEPPSAAPPATTGYGPQAPRNQSAGSRLLIALALVAMLAVFIGCSPWGRIVTDLFGR